MPGHGHRDLTGFELHDHDTPVIVDPGRGSYAEPVSLARGSIAASRSMITIPPTNRPYYDETFRRRIVRHTGVRRTQRDVYWGHGLQDCPAWVLPNEWQFNGDTLNPIDRRPRQAGSRAMRYRRRREVR